MKRFLLFFLFIISSNTLFPFGGGNGTAANPYQIKTKEHLKELADSVNYSSSNNISTRKNWSKDKYFKVMNDINDSVNSTIGNGDGYHYYFQGNFNGNQKKITLAITAPTQYASIALFAYIDAANIYNLTVDGYVKGNYGVGGICGSANGANIINCTNYGNISGYAWGGGICGGTDGGTNITNCANYGNIFTLDNYVGGIGGHTNNSNLSNCKNYGNISGYEAVGGIVGCLSRNTSTLSSCTNSGNITGIFAVGGITGHMHEGIKISNCLNTGTIKADRIVGGIAGGYDNTFAATNGSISNSVNSGLVIGKNIVGGIIGRCLGEIKNCTNTGVVSGNTNVGCIFGEKSKTATVTNCHYDKQMCY
ncbi:MAG: hypothetical protein LBR55_02515 [Bacteroidales bacterium]|jgi:hypothetical protein|nr:hypothetical protein [Bacteroidales bacterium]